MSTEDVNIFENIGDNPINFETKEEFIRYYNKNKSMIDSMKTRGLNRKYKIEGYKIGRKNNIITLYPNNIINENYNKENDENFDLNLKVDMLNERLKKIELLLKEIKENLL